MNQEMTTPLPASDQPKPSLVKKMDFSRVKPKEVFLPAAIILAIILAGVATGYFLANRGGGALMISTTSKQLPGGAEVIEGPKEVGIKDEKAFPDTAEGRIEVNDQKVVTEGSHKLIRTGGESQTAYLTSSVVNLDQFVGKCVQIWGQTYTPQQAGWFMDVGRLKVLDSCPEGV